jgi:MFS family permease
MERARRPWLALAVLCLGTFAVLLDTTIVNVALPSLITGLHASLDQALCSIILLVRGDTSLHPGRLFVISLDRCVAEIAIDGLGINTLLFDRLDPNR